MTKWRQMKRELADELDSMFVDFIHTEDINTERFANNLLEWLIERGWLKNREEK